MTLEELREEAQKYGYGLVDLRTDYLSDDDIISYAAEAVGIKKERIFEHSNNQFYVFARKLVIWFTTKYRDYNYAKIALLLNENGFNHATIIHHKKSMEDDPKYFKPWQRESLDKFKQIIENAKESRVQSRISALQQSSGRVCA